MRFFRVFGAAVSAFALVLVVAQSAFADPRDFTLQNNSAIDIAMVYVSPSDMAQWGDDIMGSNGVLPAGQAVNVTFRAFDGSSCSYDVKVVGSGGQEGYLYKVDLCSVTSVTFS
jgi:hypothetical protein